MEVKFLFALFALLLCHGAVHGKREETTQATEEVEESDVFDLGAEIVELQKILRANKRHTKIQNGNFDYLLEMMANQTALISELTEKQDRFAVELTEKLQEQSRNYEAITQRLAQQEEGFNNAVERVTVELQKILQSLEGLKANLETVAGQASGKLQQLTDTLDEHSDHFDDIKDMLEQDDEPVETQKLYANCAELKEHGTSKSGVYTIDLNANNFAAAKPVKVYCDMDTDGGGWTVFQRRKDGSVSFERLWRDYKTGFGDLNGEHWLGNDLISLLTGQKPAVEMRIDFEDSSNVQRYAKYSSFGVEGEAAQYRLTVSGYSGNAGDSLTYHSGQKFSTTDRDYDLHLAGSCAQMYKGAWWYRSCHKSNLNGFHYNGAHKTYADGIEWYTWHGYHYSIVSVEMKLR